MTAINFFFQEHDQHFKMLNSAHICLLPKRTAASSISDFRPINLTHSLDIAKAFDSVRRDYLLEVLQRMGFGVRWRAWVSILLKSATSSVLLNGVRGNSFQHGRGLRQGDPLSPLLFILAIDPLQKMFNFASQQGILSPIGHRAARLRVSLYADDAALDEVQAAQQILAVFSEASGLTTNINKCAVYPICCESVSLDDIMQPFPCQIKSFPCTYIGLPLSCRPLRKVDFQSVIDKLAAKLATWKGRSLDKSSRLTLVNSVLSAMPVHFLTVFPLKKWAIKKIDKIRRSFLWRGAQEANGGHCLVQWKKSARPKIMGGLGIIDIERFSRALRLRWLWFQWTDSSRLWVGTEPPCDKMDAALFRASTMVSVGNGASTSFWHDSWLDGKAPMDIAPNLYPFAWRKNKKVSEELTDLNWTRGLWRMETTQQLEEFISLWNLLEDIQLSDQEDSIQWKWTANGIYSSKSAYMAQFHGSLCTFKANLIRKAHAEGKHKFFTMLLIQAKILTADKLILRQWPCNSMCVLCDQEEETALHLCLKCPFALEVWEALRQWSNNLLLPPPPHVGSIEDWWTTALQNKPKDKKRTIAGILMYIAWNIWKERNRRIFNNKQASPSVVFNLPKEEMDLRKSACGHPSLI
ncbi:hypothetical protein U9M48_005869 [Paspalum notatum var. saurae]|uniref:Reverse transcriptase domain-containing protein n=1 Tax=Paspalum notatum var. saurae TaxID=547442 RepID=A0AAQ3SLI8_PASNO